MFCWTSHWSAVGGTAQAVHAEVEIEWLPEPAGFPITVRQMALQFNPTGPTA